MEGKKMDKKFLAFICKICPFCIIARLFPDSFIGKFIRKTEDDCPACKAYKEELLKKKQ